MPPTPLLFMTNFLTLRPVNELENVQTLSLVKHNNVITLKILSKMSLNSWCAQQAWNLDSFIWWSFHIFSLWSDLNSTGTTSPNILALSLLTVGNQKYRNKWNEKIMKNKSQSNLFFSLFLFLCGIKKFKKQICLTFSQSLGSSFSFANLFPCSNLVGFHLPDIGHIFLNSRAPFASNVLWRPITLMTNSLVMSLEIHTICTQVLLELRENKVFCLLSNVMYFNVGIHTIVWERQQSESTL